MGSKTVFLNVYFSFENLFAFQPCFKLFCTLHSFLSEGNEASYNPALGIAFSITDSSAFNMHGAAYGTPINPVFRESSVVHNLNALHSASIPFKGKL